MKTISPALLTHFGESCTTLAVLWRLERMDGGIMGFTTHDKDITYDSTTYQADTGMVNTAMASKSDMTVDNLEVTAFLDSSAISVADIRAGLYNYALVEIRIVNWADLSMGDMKSRKGTLGQLKMRNGVITAEIRGLTQQLSTVFGSKYGPLCRAELGSGQNGIDTGNHWQCRGVDITLYQQTGAVVSSPDKLHLVLLASLSPASPLLMPGSATPTATAVAGWFNDGIIAFTSGPMNNFKVEGKSWDGTTLTLFLPMQYQPAPGDTFVIEPGCNKIGGATGDCFLKFNNIVNFQGETFIPSTDLMLKYPNAK